MKNVNCYIHIPFCTSKCKYCRFASFSWIKKLQIQTYVDFLCEEILSNNEKDLVLDTIYFWWWTPWTLSIFQFKKIFETLKNKYIFNENIEISIETTPENVTIENLVWCKNLWINRISMWVQTLNEKTLCEIWRAWKWDIMNALDVVKKVWFNNFSIDFIIWLPYVKKWETVKNIWFLLDNYDFITHISIYMLEEYYDVPDDLDSKFENIVYPNNWANLWLKEEYYLTEYTEIKSYLNSRGFSRYEISNYSKPWFECKHNFWYWTHKESLAFWLGAFWFLDNIRFSNSENFIDYYNKKNILSEKLKEDDLFLENLMFSLRTSWIDNFLVEKLDKKEINYFLENNLLEKIDDKIILTDSGVLIMDYILGKIVK